MPPPPPHPYAFAPPAGAGPLEYPGLGFFHPRLPHPAAGRVAGVSTAEEVTQIVGRGHHPHANPHANPFRVVPGGISARVPYYHDPVPQPPGAPFPYLAYPGSASQGPSPGSPAVGARTIPGDIGGARGGTMGAVGGATTIPGDIGGARGGVGGGSGGGEAGKKKKGKGPARDASDRGAGPMPMSGNASDKKRRASEAEAEADDAGSDSMMTGQPGHSEGAPEVTAGDAGAALKEKERPPVPLAKRPRSGRPNRDGPKDQSAADILVSIARA